MISRHNQGRVPVSCTVALLAVLVAALPLPAAGQIEVAEASIAELQEAMTDGAATSAEITRAYLSRIQAYDHAGPRLNSMIWVNWDAVAEAEALDRERSSTGARGPLHGIPIILKDNYDTYDMPTSGGTLALGGQTLNPYDLTRNPGGSSGGTGSAIAASLAAIGWGSDTCGSIRNPSAQNNLVGLRSTKGLSSIDGIIPLSHTQDTGGPLARSIADLAVALDATIGADPADPATAALAGRTLPGFVEALDENALNGARIGILEAYMGGGGAEAAARGVVRTALERMVELGADTVTVEIPELDSLISGSGVIGLEAKWDMLEYLAGVPDAPVSSIGEMVELGLVHQALTPNMRRRAAVGERDSAAYATALAKREPLRDAVVTAMNAASVHALVYPTLRQPPAVIGEPQRGSNCSLSANTGLPTLSVPAGFTGNGLPIGMELLGRRFDDALLVAMGYAFEQASDHRRAPTSTPALVNGMAPAPVSFTVTATDAGRDDSDAMATGVEARVLFVYDVLTGVLDYQVGVFGVLRGDVYAVVLRTSDDEGRYYIERRLSGPSLSPDNGTITLDPAERAKLDAGELYLEIMTRGHPFGAARGQVVVPGWGGN